MTQLSGNAVEHWLREVSGDSAITVQDQNRMVVATATGGVDLTITIPSAGSVPNGFHVYVRRDPSSTKDVVVGAPASVTLTASSPTVELFHGSSGYQVVQSGTGSGSGDVTGPASAVVDNFASFASTSGKVIADSGYSATSFATATHVHTSYSPLTHVHTTYAGTTHADTHQFGSSDPVAQTDAAAYKIPFATAASTLDLAWIPASTTPAASRIPLATASSQISSSWLPSGTTASTSIPGDSASSGSAPSFSLSDHKHAREGFGTSAGTVVEGNDARLSDARTPTAHDHSGNKLAQANTHESADTDSATTALHHTLGTGANQAAAGNHSHTASDVGLGNVTNDAQVKRSEMGAASGVATLDATGKVPSTQLPSSPSGALTGEIKMYGGSSAPSGFLLCDGASYLRADYADLFTVIGTAFGSVDANHFNVPDMRGRIPAGLDTTVGGSYADRLTSGGSGINARTLGASGGAETHTLSTAQLAQHSHVFDHGHTGSSASAGDHTHSFSATTSTNGNHYHTYTAPSTPGRSGMEGTPYGSAVGAYTSSAGDHNHTVSGTTGNGGSHSHTVTVNSYSGSSGTAGTGSAHNNTQPTLVVNFIIKT